jgi:hypothetical protein
MSTRLKLSPAIIKRLKEQNLTAEDVLRKALNLKSEGFTTPDGKHHFPEGTVFMAWYKSRALSALVKNSRIEVEGKSYSSLSAAAAHYTGRPTTNGWDFWYCRPPGQSAFVQVSKAA